jgi:hypothetical protein
VGSGVTSPSILAFNTGNGWASITSSAPEPSAWALMILGVGFTGVELRRRRMRQLARF